jgi:hypothetical protein
MDNRERSKVQSRTAEQRGPERPILERTPVLASRTKCCRRLNANWRKPAGDIQAD